MSAELLFTAAKAIVAAIWAAAAFLAALLPQTPWWIAAILALGALWNSYVSSKSLLVLQRAASSHKQEA